MKVYLAMVADENLYLDEILVANSTDGIKKECERYCRELYDELTNMQTEVVYNNNKIYVHITGEDSEELYCSYNDILDTIITFSVREVETEEELTESEKILAVYGDM